MGQVSMHDSEFEEWLAEELHADLRRIEERELSRQSQQIEYEAAARAGWPLGQLPEVI